MNCPDCDFTLRGAENSCRCGWKASSISSSSAGVRARCASVGCPQFAAVGRSSCNDCETRIRQEASEAFCQRNGLYTLEQKRAYCARMARSFGRGPSFEVWVRNLTQKTVDIVARGGTKSDADLLERLRDMGAMDERNVLIPLERREELRAARRAARQRIEEELRERGIVA